MTKILDKIKKAASKVIEEVKKIPKKIKEFFIPKKAPKIEPPKEPEVKVPIPTPPVPTEEQYENLRSWIYDFDWSQLDRDLFPTTNDMLAFKIGNWDSLPEDFRNDMIDGLEDTFA